MIGKMWPVFLFFLFFAFNGSAATEASLTEPQTGMEFVLVPGGCFAMGDSSGDGDPNERPVHEVCVSDLYVGKYEVTNEQYKKFKPEHNSGQVRGVNLDEDNSRSSMSPGTTPWPMPNGFPLNRVRPIDCLPRRNGNMPPGPAPHKVIFGEIPEEACKYANVADESAKKQRTELDGLQLRRRLPGCRPGRQFQGQRIRSLRCSG